MPIEPTDSISWEIIKCLQDRGGFDSWWDEIGGENQLEVLAELEVIADRYARL